MIIILKKQLIRNIQKKKKGEVKRNKGGLLSIKIINNKI